MNIGSKEADKKNHPRKTRVVKSQKLKI